MAQPFTSIGLGGCSEVNIALDVGPTGHIDRTSLSALRPRRQNHAKESSVVVRSAPRPSRSSHGGIYCGIVHRPNYAVAQREDASGIHIEAQRINGGIQRSGRRLQPPRGIGTDMATNRNRRCGNPAIAVVGLTSSRRWNREQVVRQRLARLIEHKKTGPPRRRPIGEMIAAFVQNSSDEILLLHWLLRTSRQWREGEGTVTVGACTRPICRRARPLTATTPSPTAPIREGRCSVSRPSGGARAR
mmetsp:Transcript_13535/g.32112  ORF Transcript_13535/g.32112 Transcript_13535/m.32112 type:complete len:245 (-) Transcript_13535:170-904(-)